MTVIQSLLKQLISDFTHAFSLGTRQRRINTRLKMRRSKTEL